MRGLLPAMLLPCHADAADCVIAIRRCCRWLLILMMPAPSPRYDAMSDIFRDMLPHAATPMITPPQLHTPLRHFFRRHAAAADIFYAADVRQR